MLKAKMRNHQGCQRNMQESHLSQGIPSPSGTSHPTQEHSFPPRDIGLRQQGSSHTAQELSTQSAP